jgi:hypothetical protein
MHKSYVFAGWTAIIFGSLAPACFYLGYRPLDFELVILLGASSLAAVGVLAFASVPKAQSILLSLVVLIYILVYFVDLPFWTCAAIILGSITLLLFVLEQNYALGVVAISLIAGMSAAGVSGTRFENVQETPRGARSDIPSVIHILLDEHASPFGFAGSGIDEIKIAQLFRFYNSMGFSVYEKSYSLDDGTPASLSRMFNLNDASPETHYILDPNSLQWLLTGASTLEELGRRRDLDLTLTANVNLSKETASAVAASRVATMDVALPSPVFAELGVKYSERVIIAVARTAPWIVSRLRRERSLLHAIRGEGVEGRANKTKDSVAKSEPAGTAVPNWKRQLRQLVQINRASGRLHPAGSYVALSRFAEHLQTEGSRGTYYFAHFLLPHHPYIFAENCTVRPLRVWTMNNEELLGKDAIESQRTRYQMYYEQIKCLQRGIAAILQAVAGNQKLSDAAIVIHGDHGSRIAIEDQTEWSGHGYDEGDYERDRRAAFFAIRVPNHNPVNSKKRIRIDTIYRLLIASDFMLFDDSGVPDEDDKIFNHGKARPLKTE